MLIPVSVTRAVSTRQRRLTLSLGTLSVVLLALGQIAAGSTVDLAVFYLVPLLLVTFAVGETAGLLLALMCAALNGAVSIRWLGHALPPHAVLLNDFFKLMAFSYVALATSWVVRQRDRLHLQARTDALTGLPNYRALIERLEEEVARANRYGHGLALISMDLDHFKRYNDRLGHQEGNALLQQIAGLVLLAIRQSDRAFRYGGDELVILLPETAAHAATLLAERIHTQISADDATWAVPVTASFGVASLRQNGTAEKLLAAADAVMYRAKRAGGNRVAIADATLKALRAEDAIDAGGEQHALPAEAVSHGPNPKRPSPARRA